MSAAQRQIAYASIAAMLAHYRALESARELSADERETLAALRALLDSLQPGDRAALESDATDSAAERHRDRAQRALAREAIARGFVSV